MVFIQFKNNTNISVQAGTILPEKRQEQGVSRITAFNLCLIELSSMIRAINSRGPIMSAPESSDKEFTWTKQEEVNIIYNYLVLLSDLPKDLQI